MLLRRRQELREQLRPDAFAVLHYEPLCKPRVIAALALGYSTSFEAAAAGETLPAPCGQCPQELFHTATEYDVLYGGAAGGGKSNALLMEGIRACTRYPGMGVLAVRRTLDEHKESLLKYLAEVDFAQALDAGWNGSDRVLTFPNRSFMKFVYGENVHDATRRQGSQYQLMLFDELTMTPPEVAGYFRTRLRSGRHILPVLGVRSSCNPGGVGHAAVLDRYIEPTERGKTTVEDAQGRLIRFIQAKLDDNPYLDAGYEAELDSIADPELRRAMRDGDWDIFPDQAFTDWHIERMEISKADRSPVYLPYDWQRWCGIDYGRVHAAVAIFGATDQDGRLWVYDEVTQYGVDEQQQARNILDAEAATFARKADGAVGVPSVLGHAMDPATWGQAGSALPVAVQYQIAGLGVDKADNDRLSGKARVHTFLREAPACPHHRAIGWVTCPMLHVIAGKAPGLTKTMPSMNRDPKRLEDVLKRDGDDWYDAFRYLVMSIGASARPIFHDEFAQQATEDSEPYEVPPPVNDSVGKSPFV